MGRPLEAVDLKIPFFHQETDMWCWAAVSQMVIAHFKGVDATPPQREIARMALGEDADRWRHSIPDEAIVGHTHEFIRLTVKVLSRRASDWYPPPSAEELYARLFFGNPVIASLHMTGEYGHVVVIAGMRPGERGGAFDVLINDPSPRLPGPYWTAFDNIRPSMRSHMIVYRDVRL